MIVDCAYCERIGPGLLAELLNAVTNASFLIAAWAASDIRWPPSAEGRLG